jgi:hypothetical protein
MATLNNGTRDVPDSSILLFLLEPFHARVINLVIQRRNLIQLLSFRPIIQFKRHRKRHGKQSDSETQNNIQ